MWKVEQLESLKLLHKFLMSSLLIAFTSLVGISMVAQQEEFKDYRERVQALDRVIQVQKEVDRHDRVIEQVRSEQYQMSLQLVKMSEGLLNLNKTLGWVLWALSGIAGILMLPVASYIFNLKMRRELSRLGNFRSNSSNEEQAG